MRVVPTGSIMILGHAIRTLTMPPGSGIHSRLRLCDWLFSKLRMWNMAYRNVVDVHAIVSAHRPCSASDGPRLHIHKHRSFCLGSQHGHFKHCEMCQTALHVVQRVE